MNDVEEEICSFFLRLNNLQKFFIMIYINYNMCIVLIFQLSGLGYLLFKIYVLVFLVYLIGKYQ